MFCSSFAWPYEGSTRATGARTRPILPTHGQSYYLVSSDRAQRCLCCLEQACLGEGHHGCNGSSSGSERWDRSTWILRASRSVRARVWHLVHAMDRRLFRHVFVFARCLFHVVVSSTVQASFASKHWFQHIAATDVFSHPSSRRMAASLGWTASETSFLRFSWLGSMGGRCDALESNGSLVCAV